MMEIAKEYNLSEEDIQNCFLIGLNHDVGYEFTTNGTNHNKIGGELLRDNKVTVDVLETKDKWFGVTYKEDKETVVNSFKQLYNNGVYNEDLFSDL